MDAALAIQLEQMVALMFMLTTLVFTKMAMVELKDLAHRVHRLEILVRKVKKNYALD